MNRTPLSLVILSAFIPALWTFRFVQMHDYTAFAVIGCGILWVCFAVHLVRYIKQHRDK